MTDHPSVTVIGSANVDLIFRTPHLPQTGETLSGHSFSQCMGGKGANQAVAAARLGARTCFVARVGDDLFGSEAINAYQKEGIDTKYVLQSESEVTGTAAIMVDDTAENSIVVVPGANLHLGPDDVRAAESAIAKSDIVLCQLETPVNAAVAAFQLARSAGVRTVLTPAPAFHVPDELLGLCDFCVPNKTEISQLTGVPVENREAVVAASRQLLQRGVGNVVATLGSEGVLLTNCESDAFFPAKSVAAVDTTGAGDAFTAAFAVSIAQGMHLQASIRRAIDSAALSVTRPGTQPSFPTLIEIESPAK